jgi:hypothetical protein
LAKRRKQPSGQIEFDLWGLPEEAADQKVAAAIEAPASSIEHALVGGQLSFDIFDSPADGATDEQVRGDGGSALEDGRSGTVQAQIEATLEKLEPTIDRDLPYLEKVGTLNAMRKQAEEIALTDLVYTTPIENSLRDELDEMLGGLPATATLQDTLYQLNDQAEEEGWTEDTQAEHDQLSALLPLVTEQSGHRSDELDQLTEAEARDWILKLRPFWDQETRTLLRLP